MWKRAMEKHATIFLKSSKNNHNSAQINKNKQKNMKERRICVEM